MRQSQDQNLVHWSGLKITYQFSLNLENVTIYFENKLKVVVKATISGWKNICSIIFSSLSSKSVIHVDEPKSSKIAQLY